MTKAQFVGGMVKFVFILCYVAFMVASIRHVATFFNNFEPNNDDMIGSYALAGAFDITALVTTIGVMFFRKSMPTWVFVIIWLFIAGIAVYSYIINLEYTSHYQDMTLLMQPTGQTMPVYDTQGALHYVPVMKINTALMWINPFLASGFTIFSLVYSVIAEFFGTKAPTVGELQALKTHLEETVGLEEEIARLKAKNRKPSIIERAKETAKEVVKAGKEVAEAAGKNARKDPVTGPLNNGEEEAFTDIDEDYDTGEREAFQQSLSELSQVASGLSSNGLDDGLEGGIEKAIDELEKHYPRISAWRSLRAKSVTLKSISEVTGKHHRTVQSALLRGSLTRINRYPDRVLLTSVIMWLLTDLSEQAKIAQEETVEVPVVSA